MEPDQSQNIDTSTFTAKRIPLEGAWNVRDLGGSVSLFGGVVARGLIIRGDSPHRLTADDLALLAPIGIRAIVDLRRPEEVAHFGSGPLADGVRVIFHVPLRQAPRFEAPVSQTDDLLSLYRHYVNHDTRELADIIAFVSDVRHLPVFIHCHAGKDRTGVVAALILALLGVPDQWIAADYALTSDAFANFLIQSGAVVYDNEMAPAVRSDASTMSRLLAEIRDRHGSVEQLLLANGLTHRELVSLRRNLLVSSDLRCLQQP
ncbi:MAG: tyrosine-protein phosphatase [Ferrimicrobium sp.]|jgi:protein tyrosine/serine phosphatase|nr:tyrosine-protein phosphatase [Ferrimicrobium sp.]